MASQGKTGAPFLTTTIETTLLNDITSSITEQVRASTFSCGGGIPVKSLAAEDSDSKTSDPIQIRFGENGHGLVLSTPAKSGDDEESFRRLLSACSPASFGRGKEDVLDESYRKASKLDTDQFLTSFCPYVTGIVDIVSQLLLPNAAGVQSRGVKAELYKLNVYSAPSGKFKAHVDTPRSASQFGSLVVCLPVAHQGGQLAVRSNGKEVIFDWSANVGNPSVQPTIKWAAFYSDCEHEVLEVTSGQRVTLTYNLYLTSPATGTLAGNISRGLLDPTQLPLYAPLKAALEVPGFLPGGRILGVWLTHNYAHTHKVLSLLPSSLKGADMALYETARALGLKCLVRPVLSFDVTHDPEWNDDSSDETYYGNDLKKEIHLLADKFHPHKMCDVEIEGTDGKEYGQGYNYREVIEPFTHLYPSQELDSRRMTWLNELKSELKEPALGYVAYGNQASLGIEYSAANMLIRIPPFHERSSNVQSEVPFFEGIARDEVSKAK